MTDVSIDAQFQADSADKFFQRALELSVALGLDTTSWRVGDPTLTQFKNQAAELETLHAIAVEFFKGGYLLASPSKDFLKLHAKDQFGVDAVEGAPSTPTVTVTNTGGAFHDPDVGDVTFKASVSGKTFRNTSRGRDSNGDEVPLSPGVTLTFDLVADETGSGTTVAADDVDTLTSSLLGVEIVSSTASAGVDEESTESLITRCLNTLGALSPSGSPDAYEHVATTEALTGTAAVTRAKAIADDSQGRVTVYVAGPTGAVGSGIVADVQAAIEIWATPLCIRPTVVSATGVSVDVEAEITGTDIPADFEDTITTALEAFFATLDIGESLFTSAVIAVIHGAMLADGAPLSRVVLTLPADTGVGAGEVITLGSVSISEA